MEDSAAQDPASDRGCSRREPFRYGVKGFVGVVFLGALRFLPSGSLAWSAAWIYLVVFLLASMASALVGDPELLLGERGRGSAGRKRWGLIPVSVYGTLSALFTPIVAGLDFRYGWSPSIPASVPVVTIVIYPLGWGVHVWAMASNRFFSTVTRLETGRGHTVETGGLYRYVRHPGYPGGIIFNLGAPLILGSLWALIPPGLGALLLVWRTELQDLALQLDLNGYRGYAQRVRYRLLSGVW